MPDRRLSQARRKRHEEAADWVLLRRERALAPEEDRALRDWLDSAPENRRAFDRAEQLLTDARRAIRSDPELASQDPAPARPGRTALLGLLAVGLLAGATWSVDGITRLRADVYAGAGDLPVVTLDDGSIVHLNAASAIRIEMTPDRRIVHLMKGEALFDVAADADRPFTVTVDGAGVTALGTAFNIRMHGGAADVTVIEHAVRVAARRGDGPPLVLDEGQGVALQADGALGRPGPADTEAVLAWQDGKLVLDDAPLSEVVAEIDKRFGGEIVIASPALARKRISGTISIAEPRPALAFLGQAFGLRMADLGPVILVTGTRRN